MFLSILGFTLHILGYLLLAVLLLFLALIVIPFHYRVAGEKYEQSLFEGSVIWLFGGIRIDFIHTFPGRPGVQLTVLRWFRYSLTPQTLPVKPKHESPPPAGKSKENKHRKVKKKPSLKEFIKPDILKETLSTLVKLLNYFQPHTLSVSAKVGFSDPMMTGLLHGLLSQFHFLIHRHDVHVQPVFDEECLEGQFLIGGRVWLPTLLLMVARFLLSKPIRAIYIPKLFKKTRKSKGGPHYVH